MKSRSPAADLAAAAEDYKASYGADDAEGLMEHLSKVPRRAAAGYLEAGDGSFRLTLRESGEAVGAAWPKCSRATATRKITVA